MKKKIFALVMAVMMLAMMLTGCIQNDIGVKMNKDGTGSISATIGIEKDFYQNLKQMGSDPFEGKTTTEYTDEDSTYVAYTEVKEYSSYEEMEKALLEMTYDSRSSPSSWRGSSARPDWRSGLSAWRVPPASRPLSRMLTAGHPCPQWRGSQQALRTVCFR